MTTRPLPVLDLPAPPRRSGGDPRSPARPAAAFDEYAIGPEALPRFFVWTLGCQMNRSDSEEMAGALLAAGCAEATAIESADLVVINSCAVREVSERKVIGRMGQLAALKAERPGTRVVLTGCAVRDQGPAALRRRYPAVDLFLRPDQEPELVARLGLAGPTAPAMLGAGVAAPDRPDASPMLAARASAVAAGTIRRGQPWAAWVPVIYGCDKTCSYCIVPFSRGPERSRPFDGVVEECRRLGEAGALEVTLLGQNVNSYGHDLPREERFAAIAAQRPLGRRLDLAGRPDFAALLRAVDGLRRGDAQPAIPRLRFLTSHPWDLTDRLIEAIAGCPSVCGHLHLPVQSGDDAVLRRMGRQYAVEGYLGLVERLRAAVPGIALSTDVIVGFCGETEAQYEATLALLRAVRYDQVFAAAYSVRPGTPAARLPDDVPPEEKRRRLNALLALQEEIGRERNRSWVGREVEVLVDGWSPPGGHSHDGGGPPIRPGAARPLAGRTRENKLVHLDGGPERVGTIVHARVDHAGPYSLVATALT